MSLRLPAVALTAIALLALPLPATAAERGKTVVREFTGTVAAVTARGKSFRLRRPGRPVVVVRVSRETKVAKGAKPRKGRKLVVKARQHKKAWHARSLKLVPVVVDEEDEPSVEEPLAEEPEPEEEDTELDLEDPLSDLLGDDGSEEEPPE